MLSFSILLSRARSWLNDRHYEPSRSSRQRYADRCAAVLQFVLKDHLVLVVDMLQEQPKSSPHLLEELNDFRVVPIIKGDRLPDPVVADVSKILINRAAPPFVMRQAYWRQRIR